METSLTRMMFKDSGSMLMSSFNGMDIAKKVSAAKRKCTWLDAVPQALEHETLPLIRSILQSLHPEVCENVRRMSGREILLAYWRLQTRNGNQGPFLDFLFELNSELSIDLLLS